MKTKAENTSQSDANDRRDNFQIISDGLLKYGGYQKSSSDSKFVVCPFHDDSSPSMGVYLAQEGKIPLGFYHCFGCGAKGRWNAFAEKAGLDKIKEWKTNVQASENLITDEIENKLLGSDSLTFKAVLRVMRCEEAIRWPKHLDWRGFDGNLIYNVGGHIINDDYNEDIALLFPIKIAGRVYGGVKAIREKKHKKQLSYVTMKGEWVKNHGLFPYMYTQSLVSKNSLDFVFLVEGPRDALRLVYMGIPALAVLGATAMSRTKMSHILSLDPRIIYVLSDNDSGGDIMWKTVRKEARAAEAPIKRIKLPKTYTASGELVKMDPNSMGPDVVETLLKFLKINHSFRALS